MSRPPNLFLKKKKLKTKMRSQKKKRKKRGKKKKKIKSSQIMYQRTVYLLISFQIRLKREWRRERQRERS